MSNILGELKRRNVFKVATIYVVVSWLILQVATAVFPVFEIPNWATRLIVVLLGLGFPITMVMAWAFDLTPDGIRWEDDENGGHVHTHAWDWVIAVLLTIAIGLMVISQIDNWSSSRDTVEEAIPVETVIDVIQAGDGAATIAVVDSIAVLPFDNLGADPNDDYIGDGLAEELLSVLGRIPEFKVASRTSTAYYKNKNIDNASIAATLNVANLLSGSIRRAGDKVRVTAVLDNSETGQLLWTNTYDRSVEDILEIQSEIAKSVATAIVPVLSPESETLIDKRSTSSSEAYDFYLRGRDYLRQPTEASTLASATELFRRAVDLDPRFAEAYAGMCDANLRNYEFTLSPEYFEEAERACHRALTLDGKLWEVRVALGNLYHVNDQNDRAVMELEAAVEQQPNAVNAYLVLAGVYAAQGLLDQAERTFEKAEEVERGYWGVHRLFGHFYYDQSRFAEAIERYKRVAELVPDNSVGYDNLGNTYLQLGEFELAEEALNAAPSPSRFTYTNRGLVYYMQGKFEQAAEDQLKAIEFTPNEHRAWGRLADSYRYIDGNADASQEAYQNAIQMAEGELAINPSSWDSVARLSKYYVRTRQNDAASEQIAKLFSLTKDETAYYLAAITTLELGDTQAAYDYLSLAVEGGFSKAIIMADPDLQPLRNDNEFRAWLGLR